MGFNIICEIYNIVISILIGDSYKLSRVPYNHTLGPLRLKNKLCPNTAH